MANPISCQLLQTRARKCTSGCSVLDSFLKGGFPCGSVTELVGESASGKTQFCLQICLSVQRPLEEGGLGGSALYVYTENYFPYRRLQQIADHMILTKRRTACDSRSLQCLNVNTTPSGGSLSPGLRTAEVKNFNKHSFCLGPRNPCDRVFVQGIQTAENLLEYLDYAYTLLSQPLLMPVRVIVIDSVAALFRSDFDNSFDEMKERLSLYFQVATKLKKYAEEFNLAVIVTNQVTDAIAEEGKYLSRSAFGMTISEDSQVLVTSGRRVAPALAMSWAHCVNCRLFLSRSNGSGDGVKRTIQVIFAPHLPTQSCEFSVCPQGVRGQSDSEERHQTLIKDLFYESSFCLTPAKSKVEDNKENDLTTGNKSCERVFRISKTDKIAGTPPSNDLSQKDQALETKNGSEQRRGVAYALKLFR